MTILKYTNKLIEEQYENDTTHWYRHNINIGDYVCIVKKEHQKTGELTCGTVLRILTSKAKHTRGIKVKIKTDQGEIAFGRVQEIYKD